MAANPVDNTVHTAQATAQTLLPEVWELVVPLISQAGGRPQGGSPTRHRWFLHCTQGVALEFRDGFRDDAAMAHTNAVRIGYARREYSRRGGWMNYNP